MDRKGTAAAFFLFQLFFTCVVTVFLNPVRSGNYEWNLPILLFGFLGGITLGGFKWVLDDALKTGPPALTFATVNCASVMPAIVVVLLAGPLIDYHLSVYDITGALIVIIGLVWAGWEKPGARSWYLFAGLAFAMQLLYLLVCHSKALLANNLFKATSEWIPSREMMTSEWFVPTVFAVACGMHTLKFIKLEARLPVKSEFFWGCLGGIFNGICAFLFMYAAEIASTTEGSYIYSIFTIALITACNLWGQLLYGEKVNWKATALCILGLLITSH